MTDARRVRIDPAPTPEEAAAIVAALEALRGGRTEAEPPARSRWRLAGMLGHRVPPGMKLEGALWSYSSWEGGP
ncbi:MAG TPA: acyl-CoA carboxylase epsilon subunit [Rubrobacter sp.]|nr:acyl-CoA carboxylase epsilon subunit [Rubrobacter sp.]